MIREFVLSRPGAGGYLGTVADTGRVSLQAYGGAPYHIWYGSVASCYEALCGRPDGYRWRTLQRAD